MAIVNRTPDSFYDRGATYELAAAVDRVDQVVAEGADMVDVGGVKAAPGEDVDGWRLTWAARRARCVRVMVVGVQSAVQVLAQLPGLRRSGGRMDVARRSPVQR